MIGKVIYVYDCNCRYYNRDENGFSSGVPIYRKSFRPHKIIGETRVSWLAEYGTKIPKRGGDGIAFSEEELDHLCYVHDNRYKIADAVGRVSYDKLIQIAAVIGYDEVEA